MTGQQFRGNDSATLMDFDNDSAELRSAHVIVVGTEKGGAGKSTISIPLTVALLKAGYRVASIDLDTRQQTLTRFFENRRSWSASADWPIELPHHCALSRGESTDLRENEAREFSDFALAIPRRLWRGSVLDYYRGFSAAHEFS